MRRRSLAAAIVGLAAVLPYLPVLDDYFIQDDFGVVSLLADKPPTAFFGWFARTWMDDIWGYTPDEIRPFPAVTYQLTALWGAASPVANHVLNITLHAATALLVAAVGVHAAGLGLWAAAFAGAVFAVHPMQAETVAWVTGRVDSIPALFYLGAFLAFVRWRATGAMRLYYASLLLFVVALFSKQNTVTLAAALVLFDTIVAARSVRRVTWEWVRPYVPFVALTAGFMLLRYVLFGEVARESALNSQALDLFTQMADRHVRRMIAGTIVPGALLIALLTALLVAVGWAALRTRGGRSAIVRRVAYFGIIWVAIGVAPTLVAGYESPRHIYLASAGWAITVGLAADAIWHTSPARMFRPVTVVASLLVIAVYVTQLRAVVADWGDRAEVSRRAVEDLEREVLAAPQGSLVLTGVPPRSWEWSLPFAARPPFTSVDLTKRATLVYPSRLHCCRPQWEARTREALAQWIAQPGSAEVIALSWDERTGQLSRRDGRDEPYLQAVVEALPGVADPAALERAIRGAIAIATAGQGRR
jgi:hypothetical protein